MATGNAELGEELQKTQESSDPLPNTEKTVKECTDKTPSAEFSGPDILSPLKLSNFELAHRVVLAPVTRCRALDNVPQPAHVTFYSQRTTKGGFLISEAAAVCREGIGFPNSPGIFSKEQVEGWRKVVDAVHEKGGIIFCQLWHVGRASHSVYQPDGGAPVSSTDKAIADGWTILMPDGSRGDYSKPRALETAEIPGIVNQFRLAARNAMAADGLTYLGYRLKPNCYTSGDWLWLIERIEHRIGLWCYRSLTLGGRVILINSVLESMPVYWMTLHKIPKMVLNHIRKLVASFLWSGNNSDEKLHLVKWSNIARPKSLGGWGLKDMELFGRALRMKSLWRFVHSHSIWSQICSIKYLRGVDKEEWLMKGLRSWGPASPVWKALLDTRQWIQPGLTWLIGSGEGIALQDLRNDGDLDYILSPQLIAFFRLRGYYTLSHFCTHSPSIMDHWKDSSFFNLNGDWKNQWDKFISSLRRLGIRLTDCADKLFWLHNPIGKITAKSAYLHLSTVSGPGDSRWWDLSIWRFGAPLKIVCFFWLMMNNRILTWEQLCKRGWSGPGICVLCRKDSEDYNHLFIHCPVAFMIWQYVCDELHITMTWRQATLSLCFERWNFVHKQFNSLPLFICWGIWLLRNGIIFEDRVLNWVFTGIKILSYFKEFNKDLQLKKIRVVPPLDTNFELVGFFDGAADIGRGGCGFILYLNRKHFFHGWTGLSCSTNNLAEIFAVWILLHWARFLNLNHLHIFGDSLLVINWLNGTSHIQAKNLFHHCSNIRSMITLFEQVSFQHIFRQHNMIADSLSKKGLECPEGLLQIEEWENDCVKSFSTHRLFS